MCLFGVYPQRVPLDVNDAGHLADDVVRHHTEMIWRRCGPDDGRRGARTRRCCDRGRAMRHGGKVQSSESLRLRPPRHQVSRRAIPWWMVQAAVSVVLVLVGIGVVLTSWPFATTWLWWVAAAVLLLGSGYVVVMPQWRFRVHRWEVTDDAVYTSAGWLSQEWRVAPMSRIQTVDTERGPLQQLFGLSTVTVTTASAAGALQVTGLDHRLARDLVEQLTATTQATPGDAT